jgi:predicted Zn-dependent protease
MTALGSALGCVSSEKIGGGPPPTPGLFERVTGKDSTQPSQSAQSKPRPVDPFNPSKTPGQNPTEQRQALKPPFQLSSSKEEEKRTPKATSCVKIGQSLEAIGDKPDEDPQFRKKRYDEAMVNYRQALQIDPKLQSAMHGTARIYKKQGELQEALSAYEKTMRMGPETAILWYERGMCHGGLKQWDHQIQCLQRAATLEPSNTWFTTQLGLAYARAERYPEAERHLSQSVGESQACYYLALMTQHLNKPDLSRRYARAAFQTDPTNTQAKELMRRLDTSEVVPASVLPPAFPTRD